MPLFGTNDVVYVPDDALLTFDDLYRWQRIRIDVHHLGFRVRSAAFDEIAGRIRGAIDIAERSPRLAATLPGLRANADEMLRALTAVSGGISGELPGILRDDLGNDGASWWLRLSDRPAESFFDEDYRELTTIAGEVTPYFTYGSAHMRDLDDLEVPLAGDGDYGLPFAIDVPAGRGIIRQSIPSLEPLPLIHEFCGHRGNSATGHTINITTLADIADNHDFCTPLGRAGERLFATLYIHFRARVETPVIMRLRGEHFTPCLRILERSQFESVNAGPNWHILARSGDVVHLYNRLEGKESEGIEYIPPFLLVASASGQSDPMHRSDLLEAIRESLA